MSREFVDSVVTGNNMEAETALEIKRKEHSKAFVNNVSPEETDVDA